METLFNNNSYVLNLAPNGIIPTKEMTPYVPITPKEVIEDIASCMQEGGITYVHIHARNDQGINTSDKNIYAKFIEAIRNNFEYLPICVSCSGRLDPSFEKRSEVLELKGDLKPDMASLTLSSLNFPKTASINEPDTIKQLAQKMLDNGIKPEIEIFSSGMMNYANYMINKELLKPPYYFNILLGNIFSAQAKCADVATILSEMPDHSIWSVGGIGKFQMPAHLLSLSQGGGIRTGIEDSIYYDKDKTMLATNKGLVKKIHQLAELSDLKMIDMKSFKNFIQQ